MISSSSSKYIGTMGGVGTELGQSGVGWAVGSRARRLNGVLEVLNWFVSLICVGKVRGGGKK